MIEYPPILQGSLAMQLSSIRDYLVRLAENLASVTATATNAERAVEGQTASGIKRSLAAEITNESVSLKSLIVKTADVINASIDAIETELHSDYVAQSTFGTYQESVSARFTATAANVTEAYSLATSTDTALTQLKTQLDGEIRRGVIEDPETGLDVIGIAISQKLVFEENGLPYVDSDYNTWYRLASQQAFALYTATGWQYWINGQRVGWFASSDSSLHFGKGAVENNLRFSDTFMIAADSNGFGVRYIGG